MLKKLWVGIVAGGLLLSASPADAGKPMGELQITPAEPTVEDEIVLSNVDEDASTCEAPPIEIVAAPQLTPIFQNALVDVTIEDAEGQTVLDKEEVEPDEDGNWSVDVGELDEGDYTAYAVCFSPLVDAVDPEALPDFQYEPLEFSVSQVPPSSSSTTTTAGPATTTTAAAAAASLTAPRYTG